MAPLLATPMGLWFSSRIVLLRFSVPDVKPFCIGSVVSLGALDFDEEDDELAVLALDEDDELGLLDLPDDVPVDDDAVFTGVEVVEFLVDFDSDLELLLVVTVSDLDGADVDVELEDDFLISMVDIAMKPSTPPLRTLYQPSFLPTTSIFAPGFRCASVR